MARPKIKKEESYPICERCNNKAQYLIRIDSNQITGKADWHRYMPKIVHICNDCAKELSDSLDKCWLLKGKNKYEIKNDKRKVII